MNVSCGRVAYEGREINVSYLDDGSEQVRIFTGDDEVWMSTTCADDLARILQEAAAAARESVILRNKIEELMAHAADRIVSDIEDTIWRHLNQVANDLDVSSDKLVSNCKVWANLKFNPSELAEEFVDACADMMEG
jgi:hypothetical protein